MRKHRKRYSADCRNEQFDRPSVANDVVGFLSAWEDYISNDMQKEIDGATVGEYSGFGPKWKPGMELPE